MTHEEIINTANLKGFDIVILNNSKPDQRLKGFLAGNRLSFAMAYNRELHIQCEITWGLAERIATGQTNEIYF